MTSSDTLALIVLVCILVLALGGAIGLKKLSDHQDSSDRQEKLVLAVIKESTISQRLMTCIMSIPQDKREDEYRKPDSFCHRMSAPQQ